MTKSLENFGKIASAFLICFMTFFGTKVVFASGRTLTMTSNMESFNGYQAIAYKTTNGSIDASCASSGCNIPFPTSNLIISTAGKTICTFDPSSHNFTNHQPSVTTDGYECDYGIGGSGYQISVSYVG